MTLDWILSPLAFYGALALSLIASLGLALSFKLEICKARQSAEQSNQSLASQLRKMECAMGRLREDVTLAGEPPVPGPGMNLTRRARTLSMHFRGESVETIAAAIGAPRNEIELLLKIQKMLEC